MTVLKYLIVILIGYLVGCSSMAFYLSKLKGIDIRNSGSGNLGASNTMVVLGWGAAILVGIHDIGKAVIAVLLAKYIFPELDNVGAVAGVACVLGHIFPFYLKFKGGKGFASYYGMTLALNWKFALVVGVIIVLVTLITDYISLSTTTTIILVPLYLGIMSQSFVLVSILLIATATMLIKHRENYVRILNGTEIGLRRANRGDFRET